MEDDIRRLPDWDRVFRPGVDFSEAPVAKWEHAYSLSQKLRSEYNDYRNTSGDETTAEVSEDGRRITFRARLETIPPVGHWSLLFADALHNYRSALDGLAWELAHLDGNEVGSEWAQKLYFPLAAKERDWRRLKKNQLASMPPVILSRLEAVQPFKVEPVDQGIGILLHRMDILDKHRNGLSVELRVMDRQTFGLQVGFEDEGTASDFDYQFEAPQGQVSDGDVVFVFRVAHPVVSAKVEKLPLLLGVDLDGAFSNIFDLLALAEQQVAATFITACVGLPDERWGNFIYGTGDRPTTRWFPDVARYPAEFYPWFGLTAEEY